MRLSITITNQHGELFDKFYEFNSLDEMRNFDLNKVVDEAEENGNNDGMLGTFDSKEEADEAVRGDNEDYLQSSRMDEVTAGEIY